MQSIEHYFFNLPDSEDLFPDKKDKKAIYKQFKDFMNREVHKDVKAITAHYNPKVYLNDHSEDHVAMVMEKIAGMLFVGDELLLALTPYELFLLLIAIQIHDAGHIVGGRDGHAQNAGVFMKQLNPYEVSPIEKKVIADIAKAHSGKDDPIGRLETKQTISNSNIRVALLAALLRMGDELADGNLRGSNYLLGEGIINEESELYHVFSQCLDTFTTRMDSHEVEMSFYIKKEYAIKQFKKDDSLTFLLDEIYERTMKTFLECLYYNRFVPECLRLKCVNVNINFIDESSLSFYHKPISYRIEESGYPVCVNDIFNLCSKDLVKDGAKIDGSYICNTIQQS